VKEVIELGLRKAIIEDGCAWISPEDREAIVDRITYELQSYFDTQYTAYKKEEEA
jgi:hypothetical protein